ncbi:MULTISPECIES: tRNA 2-thiouridine(34) synthase MnmA [Auritidibacter]|uniref:tRNA-specific 2-thiouridylase MnmA n=1 Tax=Auritidibacter ignavus TaxID=678932 RepID=A0AAJ6AP49_9MICC|nr:MULTISPECIES: tRNA 2-thiouridine(34) synthase MnmA [Auritidibacter]PXA80827.1 tRNA 2-thiouridine(34) synthase MnmA [Auritidibacter sp. NML120779]AXR73162.1 tRNA 2-thiouridine(34) synthase MnmA [Auritidibacter sp. NML130574]NIH71614.1 tRNA-specific 2-thiouridylase [Auritidibacter ignavus]PXA81917.1 tRNA 2-thiouridine(34) synthase MnmA [Auritidibacter sp. NML120636]RMX24236.1 tRNA 2-thiouridine(34) synthase MnmA [Auritidibacter ignavus]
MKVLAAMSGGVDSSVAAARAVDAGHEVVGVHLALSRMPGTLRTGSRGCCTIEDSRDAWRACEKLGIPYYTWDFSERFKEDVVDDFIAEYAAGRTPNPCMRCNERIKFAALLEKALALGFDAVCTGHYAKVIENDQGHLELHRAADDAKDQSYVLGVLTAEQLEHCLFPLGDTPSKSLVRAEAADRGLSVAQKPDSYDICFIPEGDTREWLEEHIEMRPGQIVDTAGTALGQHRGAQAFTVGQRKGLGIGTPAPDGKPRFVLEVRPKENEVVVGPRAMLNIDRITGIRPSWAGQPLDEEATGEWFDCQVQVRAHADPVPGRVRVASDEVDGAEATVWQMKLDETISGVAPGQTAVVYQGTRVVGQTTIHRAVNAERMGAWV